ncbi:MarR family winged helix-turn-helix transcriptional regulator [Chengkuizengella axinellae]|uniref:MarR family transcriptional regulator n=1 Tax=Chengkuizengella axinellae TaxID=3064388 RepID=A0ABT9J3C7_9BACL|nr:MarR family transcriptional regulator [Chengkuizengella sp. 2205SS18-9]MDP5275942.1 MarR family transcriptional regulator [Chengkuizengella sp. 2205SS18-9]
MSIETQFENQQYKLRQMLQILMRTFSILEKEGARCCSVTLVESHILFEVKRYNDQKGTDLSLNELSAKLGVSNSTLSRQIQSLVDKNLLYRTHYNNDRRYLSIYLTPEGERYEKELGKELDSYVQEIFSNVPSEKRMQLLESMDVLLTAVEKSDCC